MDKKKIFIISGPSGVGKTSITKGAVRELPWLKTGITYTTRPERTRQKEDKKIFFISPKKFQEKIKKNDFLEWAQVHGYYYGTDKKQIAKIIKKYHLILNIDVQGALQIKKKLSNSILIFIKPDSLKILEKRIKKRDKISFRDYQARIKGAKKELKETSKYDYFVINREGKLKEAIKKVKQIICSKAKPYQVKTK